MTTPVLHIPIDFERREDVRRFQRALGYHKLAIVYLFRMWVDWATAGTDFRKLRDRPRLDAAPDEASMILWADYELTHIIEDFCGWIGEPGALISMALDAGVLRLETRDGVEGLVLNDFWTFNEHFSKQYKTMQQKGAAVKNARHSARAVRAEAEHQVRIIEGRGRQFALPLDAKVTSDEIRQCVALVMMMDRACDKPLRKSLEYTQNEPLMNTALQVVRRYAKEEIEKVFEYVITNRDNPRLGKIPERILEQFGKHLEAARGLVAA